MPEAATTSTATARIKVIAYLNGLSVVGLHDMEVEAVNPSPRSDEDAALLVEVSAHVD